MKKYKRLIIAFNCLIVLMVFNYSIYKNEQLLDDSSIVFFELAPVDPRSLMQGDYMVLDYKNSRTNSSDSIASRGYLVFNLDENNVCTKVRLQKEKEPLNDNEYILKYTKRNNWRLNFGAESYFFEEGQADSFERAEYGALKIDEEGNSLLVGLYDKDLKKINPKGKN
ncbi:GDYXXLXY domain-containing protein [Flammeovirga sp. EKP202]|uniref:GDYXXLXY domain-containing protein n=1 Tax=Flammeovirga sp. EKP202 TaxID=2770592 RepID=UPI00165EC9C1|nr:GDYXXLXY domain-containing protein [Flammeovirga sp. EKP202]MBD0405184.1 GDYXXLXY domain-containing protein [Flammeovirga sp. EKP202]